MSHTIAIFPGSFDPFTRGHQALVDDALRIFDKVVIGIGNNVSKAGLLRIEARKQLIEDLYADNPRVEVRIYTGLTGDFARDQHASAIIRGVRNTTDFEYERTMEATNHRLHPDIITVMLFTPAPVADIASSTVREVLAFGRTVDEFMPEGIDIKKNTSDYYIAMMEFTAEMIAGFLGGQVAGDKEAKVHTVSSIEEGEPGALTYLTNPKYEKHLYKTRASIVLVNKDFTPSEPVTATLIKVEDTGAAVLKLLQMYQAAKPRKQGISERASISERATLGEDCYVGDFAVIEAGARIGADCQIYPQVYIGDGVTVGDGTILYPGVKIYEGCVIGSRCILHAGAVIGADGFGFIPNAAGGFDKIPQLGNVVVEDDVEIGANTCIDRAKTDSTIIRRGVKLDNLIQIGHNVQIGENTVSSAQTGIAGTSKVGAQLFPRGTGRHRGPRDHRRQGLHRLQKRSRQRRT